MRERERTFDEYMEMCSIRPFGGVSRQELKKVYDEGKQIIWTLHPETFEIRIAPRNGSQFLRHADLDEDAYRATTIGTIENKEIRFERIIVPQLVIKTKIENFLNGS